MSQQQQRQEQSSGSQQSGRTSEEMISAGAAGASQQQQQQRSDNYDQHYRSSYDMNDQHNSGGYDHGRESDEYENSQYVRPNQYSHESAQERVNGIMGQPAAGSGGGYSVASTHDYLGYPKDQQPFDNRGGDLWDDDRKSEELW